MKSIWRHLSLLALVLICLPLRAESPRIDPSNTYALIVGVLNWQQRSLTTYPAQERQDVALRDQLRSLGVPNENMILLLDSEATRDAIHRSLEKLTQAATEKSTLVVYYAGHGMYCKDQGVFANYDIRTDQLESSGWCHNDLAETIRSGFQGQRVLLFADCCFSGALANVAEKLNDAGIGAASLTSAAPTNTSTNNWTFTLTLVDLLKGQPLADANGDGEISIAEAGDEVRRAMSIHERQASGYSVNGIDEQLILATVRPVTSTGESLAPFERGQYVQARNGRRWVPARVLDGDEKTLTVRFQEYNRHRVERVPRSGVRPSSGAMLAAAEPPKPLPAEEALKKASVGGKYSELLKSIRVESDLPGVGPFRDWGSWSGGSWGGYNNLPAGYWVYVYPNWYIWAKSRAETSSSADPLELSETASRARLKSVQEAVAKQSERLKAIMAHLKSEREQLARLRQKESELKRVVEQFRD